MLKRTRGVCAALATLMLLAGCASTPPPPNVPIPATPPTGPVAHPGVKIVGLLELRVQGAGEGGALSATATFIHPPQDRLSSQTSTAVPIVNAADVFERSRVVFLDDDQTNTRYVTSIFSIANKTAQPFANLTLYAVHLPGIDLGGTALSAIYDAKGTALTDPALAQDMLPTNGMRYDGLDIAVSEQNADFQIFLPDEAQGLETQAAALTPPITGEVLEYGFVARNLTGGRAIAAGTNGDCTATACKGLLSLAYQFPKKTPRSDNPWSFTLHFIVADESDPRVTVSNEERAAPQAAITRANTLSASAQIAVFGTNPVPGVGNARTRWSCSVRTAVSPSGTSLRYFGFAPTDPACVIPKYDEAIWDAVYWR